MLTSTSEVYGDPAVSPQTETYWGNVNPVGPRSVYDEAKRFAEAITAAYRRAGQVNTGIVQIFNTYGPGMRPDDGRIVPTFGIRRCGWLPLAVTGDGSQTRSLKQLHRFDTIRPMDRHTVAGLQPLVEEPSSQSGSGFVQFLQRHRPIFAKQNCFGWVFQGSGVQEFA